MADKRINGRWAGAIIYPWPPWAKPTTRWTNPATAPSWRPKVW